MGERNEESIQKLFKEWDSDGSGTIEREELSAVMKKLCGLSDEDIDTLIDEADQNKDGVIDYNEFLDWLLKPAAKSSGAAICDYHSVLKPMFACYDRDGSGDISVEEFMECHQIMQGALALFPGDEDTGAEIKIFQVDKDAELAFEEVDTSGDDKVSFAEFIHWQQKLFDNAAMNKQEVKRFIATMTKMLQGIFDIQEQVESGYADDDTEQALATYIQGLSQGIRDWCAHENDAPKTEGDGGSGWTEPPVGLNAETLKRTYTKMYPMKMRNVKNVEITVLCVPMPDEHSKEPGARGWSGAVSRRVTFEPDEEGEEDRIVTHKTAYFEYEHESFSWKARKGDEGKDFSDACEALAPEMRLFCLLKTMANFGLELSWKQILASLAGAVDMQLLTEGNRKEYRQHMIDEAIKKGKAEGFLDANEDYALGALDQHLVLRPRQVMAKLTQLGMVSISDVWKDFVNSN